MKKLLLSASLIAVCVFFVAPYVNKRFYGSTFYAYLQEKGSASLADLNSHIPLPDISLEKCVEFASSIGTIPARVQYYVETRKDRSEAEEAYVSPYAIDSSSQHGNRTKIDTAKLKEDAKNGGKTLWNAYISFWVRREEQMGDLQPVFDALDDDSQSKDIDVNLSDIDVSDLYID